MIPMTMNMTDKIPLLVCSSMRIRNSEEKPEKTKLAINDRIMLSSCEKYRNMLNIFKRQYPERNDIQTKARTS
jgi:hypothetical protein